MRNPGKIEVADRQANSLVASFRQTRFFGFGKRGGIFPVAFELFTILVVVIDFRQSIIFIPLFEDAVSVTNT